MNICRKIKKWFVNIDTGFIKEQPKKDDYKVGESPIEHDIRIYDGNWTDHLPEDEMQRRNNVETMACVSFSALNSIEMQINWMINTDKISVGAMNFLNDNDYISNGKVNLSDRFLAITSDTTPRGNYLTKVAQTIRKFGVIPEGYLSFGSPNNWGEYHDKDKVDDNMLSIGKEFLNYFNIQYEWVVAPNSGGTHESKRQAVLKQLQHTPLQIAKDGHATDYFDGVDGIRFMQYDSYGPFTKERPWSYDPYYVMKILVTEKSEFSDEQIATARKYVLEVMKERPLPYFWRPKTGDSKANGESFLINPNGSFKYKKGIPCALFESLVVNNYLTPINADIWGKFRPAEIK